MPLQNSPNAITLANIQTEFGGTSPISITEYYAGAGIVPAGTVGYPGGVLTAIPSSGAISLANFYGASAAPQLGAFFGGGIPNTNNSYYTASISLLNFSTETTSESASGLTTPGTTGACGSTLTRGYVFGTNQPLSFVSSQVIGRYQFTTLTYSNTSASMPSGWITGGSSNDTVARVMNSSGSAMYMSAFKQTTTTKFVPSSETVSSINVSTTNHHTSGVGYSTTKAYLLGGMTNRDQKTSTFTNSVKRFFFSTETYDTALFNINNSGASRISFNTSTAAYNLAVGSTLYQKLTFATETLSDAGTYNSSYTNMGASTGNGCYSKIKGYFISNNGAAFGSSPFNTLGFYSFDTDTSGALAATLPVARNSATTGSTQSAAI